jgi:hypothetical protein
VLGTKTGTDGCIEAQTAVDSAGAEYWRNADRLHYFLISRIERPALRSAA